jgi:Rieske Fe-S protein
LLGVGGAVKCEVGVGDDSVLRIILVRPCESDYRAFADACTHNGKELSYLHEEGMLACSGRSSRFDLEGKVMRGPAELALPRYAVRMDGGQLVIEF